MTVAHQNPNLEKRAYSSEVVTPSSDLRKLLWFSPRRTKSFSSFLGLVLIRRTSSKAVGFIEGDLPARAWAPEAGHQRDGGWKHHHALCWLLFQTVNGRPGLTGTFLRPQVKHSGSWEERGLRCWCCPRPQALTYCCGVLGKSFLLVLVSPDGWTASPTRWTWVSASVGSWWWTGKPGALQSMGSQRVRHDWATELNGFPQLWKDCKRPYKVLLSARMSITALFKVTNNGNLPSQH